MPSGVSARQSCGARADGKVIQADETYGIFGDVREAGGFRAGDLVVKGDVCEGGRSVANALAGSDGRRARGVVEPATRVCGAGAEG